MKTIELLMIAAIGFMLLNSCKRKYNEPQRYLGDYPLGEIKDYLYFQPGSMWVYECDSTLELDTQVMQRCDTFVESHSYINLTRLSSTVLSINEGSTYNHFHKGTIAYNDNYSYYWSLFRNRRHPTDGSVGSDAVFYKPFDSTISAFGNSTTRYKGHFDSMQVLGKWYYDIQKFEIERGTTFAPPKGIETWDNARQTLYWARNIGLIRSHIYTIKRGFNTEFIYNWNLKEYKLI